VPLDQPAHGGRAARADRALLRVPRRPGRARGRDAVSHTTPA